MKNNLMHRTQARCTIAMLWLGLLLIQSLAVPAVAAPQTTASETALNAGIAEFKKGKFKDAKKKFQDALKADPESKKAYQYLGSTLTTLGEYDAAIRLFRQYLAKWPGDDFAYRGIATVQLAAKRFDKALETTQKARELDPTNYEVDYLMACALIGLNRPLEAREAADSALKRKPDYENGLRARLQAGYRLYALKNGLISNSGSFLAEEERNRLKAEKAEIFNENASSIRDFLKQPNAPNRRYWEEQAAQVAEFAAALSDSVKPEDGDVSRLNYQRPKVLKMPVPKYTDDARQNHVNGKVTMLVLVDEKGAVDKLLVVDGLPHGLTESALKTVGGGKFSPALRDGKPVKAVTFIEVTYNIY